MIMPPFALFAHNWPEAGGDFFNVVAPGHDLHGSTVSRRTCLENGIHPISSDEEAQRLIRLSNSFYFSTEKKGLTGTKG
jgi:hypothetical protein